MKGRGALAGLLRGPLTQLREEEQGHEEARDERDDAARGGAVEELCRLLALQIGGTAHASTGS